MYNKHYADKYIYIYLIMMGRPLWIEPDWQGLELLPNNNNTAHGLTLCARDPVGIIENVEGCKLKLLMTHKSLKQSGAPPAGILPTDISRKSPDLCPPPGTTGAIPRGSPPAPAHISEEWPFNTAPRQAASWTLSSAAMVPSGTGSAHTSHPPMAPVLNHWSWWHPLTPARLPGAPQKASCQCLPLSQPPKVTPWTWVDSI